MKSEEEIKEFRDSLKRALDGKGLESTERMCLREQYETLIWRRIS